MYNFNEYQEKRLLANCHFCPISFDEIQDRDQHLANPVVVVIVIGVLAVILVGLAFLEN